MIIIIIFRTSWLNGANISWAPSLDVFLLFYLFKQSITISHACYSTVLLIEIRFVFDQKKTNKHTSKQQGHGSFHMFHVMMGLVVVMKVMKWGTEVKKEKNYWFDRKLISVRFTVEVLTVNATMFHDVWLIISGFVVPLKMSSKYEEVIINYIIIISLHSRCI